MTVAAFRTFACVLSSGLLQDPATEANVTSRLATFQQFVTTPTVKEQPGQQLAEQPDLRTLDSSIGKAESAPDNGGDVRRTFGGCHPLGGQ